MTPRFRYGDVLWVDLDPAAGHEQTKRRPVVVISNDAFNRRSGLTMVVPISHTDNHYPLHIEVGTVPDERMAGDRIRGWAQAEQLKSLDLEARNAIKVSTLADDALTQIVETVLGCLIQPEMTIVNY
ncbi:MAG: type II toxin-antitoxin system PemK/MazF family toxin [Bifidobacterium tibiigranuli]|uniref:type II toxin-antitoxin system PemK/MazF family toxin n=1 Tax=Bifidobacterium tibiigranuli TaxID=2172043 RepID=UPI0023524B8A|nr:type II toxin-antitoxin system PemK/MazF family toxin [Bifidobacterium tibiigranuli]MCH4189228.1 type II toxin-antitoxin system PemK/MazF family toxin [Bifidobacterium tibiigranuli]MCH4202767.1 type II toxin-antitoxin system PemK/MazF family toxin [Bifidobacterium tibiigranuli]MCH4273784.1 type II toxin-antitoxin system PemK/MazF family toxin [Bifidobacterium tibiigranuli]MCI1791710.1 type II toxin-antitoxin system PemK/MazF family toxin [Bifidobacterium tibiigranuli]